MSNRKSLLGMCLILGTIALIGTMGCAAMNRSGKGAVIGAATGGAVGAVIGNNTGSTTRGAIIGAVVGGTAGAIIGHQMDKRAEEIARNVPAATVERVGEGINITFPSGLLFDFNSDVLRATAAANLDELSRNLSQYGDSNLLIAGHTDAKGGAGYNQALSERRAKAAARYMTAQGLNR